MKTLSSMITGIAPIGSSTPPICDAAERWTFFPICAQDPTSAWESIMHPVSMNAPILMYEGGIIIVPAQTQLPLLIDEPPGTSLTLLSTSNGCRGSVDLSK